MRGGRREKYRNGNYSFLYMQPTKVSLTEQKAELVGIAVVFVMAVVVGTVKHAAFALSNEDVFAVAFLAASMNFTRRFFRTGSYVNIVLASFLLFVSVVFLVVYITKA